LASRRLPLLLALEIASACRQAERCAGNPAADPGDEPRQSALGRSPHPWRAPQARHRCRPDLRCEVHGAAKATSVPRLENVPPQPCRRDRLNGPLRGSNHDGHSRQTDSAAPTGDTPEEKRSSAIAAWSAMVGAMVLARLVNNDELSKEILAKTRASLPLK
jgi:hypothetical protein